MNTLDAGSNPARSLINNKNRRKIKVQQEEVIIGVDLSLRSTGIVAINSKKELIDFMIISSCTGNEKTKSNLPIFNNEELLNYNTNQVVVFLNNFEKIKAIAIEGLSFGGLSGSKDILQGNFWVLRCRLRYQFSFIPVGIIPSASWRSKVLNKIDRKNAVEKYGKKKSLKMGCVEKLPEEIRIKFENYIKENKLKKDSIFDLTDAFFIASYRWGLEK